MSLTGSVLHAVYESTSRRVLDHNGLNLQRDRDAVRFLAARFPTTAPVLVLPVRRDSLPVRPGASKGLPDDIR